MEPENRPSKKETHLPNHPFSGSMFNLPGCIKKQPTNNPEIFEASKGVPKNGLLSSLPEGRISVGSP